jgi:hypothetical protein
MLHHLLEDSMSIIPKLVTLGLVAALNSPTQQRQIDYRTELRAANASISSGS